MTKDQKLCLIDTFREVLFENNSNSIDNYSSSMPLANTFEIDRFLLKDICHLLNLYKKEIINNEIQ
jgi:hypothetical protein